MILFQLGKNFLLVDTFTEYIGLNNRNQQRQEIIITQPGRIIIEEYQEHDGHQIHHELHTRHLLLSGGILHIDFGVYQVGNSHQQTEKADVITKIGRYQRYDARIEKVAPFMGIRESRVIVGKYVLTAEDILEDRRFDDAIAVAGYPVDIHHAKGGDCTLYWCDDCYDIPYRTLIPAHVGNLLVAGRCSSMNHEAMASTRVMSTCMALGEAAGRAARLALKAGVQPADLDVEALRAELRATGAYLG